MLLGFKKQFAQFVEEGSKTHTIRAKRKIRPKVGEICHCYTGLRQKGARLLGRWKCIRVQEITIAPVPGELYLSITIDGVTLSPDEAYEFLVRDGFRPETPKSFGREYTVFRTAMDFWEDRLTTGAWTGDLIHWEYAR